MKIGSTQKGSQIDYHKAILLEPDHSDFLLSEIADDCVVINWTPDSLYTLIEIRKVSTLAGTKAVNYWLSRDNLKNKEAMIERMEDVNISFVQIKGSLCKAKIADMGGEDKAVMMTQNGDNETWIIL